MINWTIKIQSPILTLGMSFQVKYRKLPSTVWVSFSPNPTTNEFTIPNLENGDYEAEIRTICTNGELSNPVYHSNAAGQTCPVVTDLSFTENPTDPSSYQHRGFNFNWTRQIGLMYRLEFQNGGVNAGFNDSTSGINSNVPITIFGLTIDKVRVITICPSGEVSSAWIDIAAAQNPNLSIELVSQSNGVNNFKVIVANAPFVGFANTIMTNNTTNSRRINANYSPFGDSVEMPQYSNLGTDVRGSQAVNIPIGIYDASIMISSIVVPTGETVDIDAAISFGFDGVFENSTIFSPSARLLIAE